MSKLGSLSNSRQTYLSRFNLTRLYATVVEYTSPLQPPLVINFTLSSLDGLVNLPYQIFCHT